MAWKNTIGYWPKKQNMNVGMVIMDLYRCFLKNSRICVLGSNHTRDVMDDQF